MSTPATPGFKPRPHHLNIAILAMGGEGGGVLTDWIVDLAEHEGWTAQSTSVPGVAQRTGATIYYIELHRREAAAQDALPVMALSPFAGDVDVVIASELMEAGRAVQRGLVTPYRTTLITSSHRVYSMTEKTAMGDGRVSSERLLQTCREQARQLLVADFAQAAQSAESVISASLLGALAHSGALPFPVAAFEAAVQRSGIGVRSSLQGMAAGREALQRQAASVETASVSTASKAAALALPKAQETAPEIAALIAASGPALQPLLAQALHELPAAAHAIVLRGLRRLADYQDPAYAADYLQRLRAIAALDRSHDQQLLRETARHLALWMSYEDTSRVADLKTRRSRFERVHQEVRPGQASVLDIHEYLHPRLEEIAEVMPARLGRWLLHSRMVARTLGAYANRSRIVQTNSIRGFVLLYLVASMRKLRRQSLRYQHETAQIGQWLGQIAALAPQQPELALAVAKAQRLVKGYSDTIVRGRRNFQTVMASLPLLSAQPQAAQTFQALCDAALADDTGTALQQALERLHNQHPSTTTRRQA